VRSQRSGCWGCWLFASFFLLAGGAATYFFFVRPALRVVDARAWQPVPCTILDSHVETHSGSDSNTYSIAVRFAYGVEGREYESDRYEFMGGSSSGYDFKAGVVAKLPVGTRTICYYNPADPADAVLERGFTRDYLYGLIPLVFVLAGVAGFVMLLSGGGGDKTRKPMALAPLPAPLQMGPVDLKPRASPVGKLAGMTFVALFWNGIVSVFLWQDIQAWRTGGEGLDGCSHLFLTPFVLIGLAFFAGVGYYLLALFNPRPYLVLSSASAPPGGAVQLTWRFVGASGRIRHLRMTLVGREEAEYRQGTDTRTDKETFATIGIVDTTSPAEIVAGSANFFVPDPTMHSFRASHNRIVWELQVRGEIDRWPDVDEDYEFIVCPKGAPPRWIP
jgi:hypothetical protein